MKKVAIISRHAISNYGSFFQAVALEKAVKKLGYEACTINYINKKEKSYNMVKIDIKNSKWNQNIIRKIIFYIIDGINRFIQFNKFEKYRRVEMNLTDEFNQLEDIKKKKINADIYCTGSDQVWNETINNELDLAYFLDFLEKEDKPIAYAASFGKDYINKEKIEIVKKELEKYKFISVRENQGVNILKDIGIDSKQVLDPTLLLNAKDWLEMASQKKCKRKFILIYQIHKNSAMIDYAKKYAKKHGYDIYNISVSFIDKKKGIKLKWCPSYREVLWLFNNATCIITDSFHATAFSINLNKNFVTFLPKKSTSRNRSILKLFDLESRSIENCEDFETPEKNIDYEKVNVILEEERKKSLDYLDYMLRNVN